ncbi:Uu.00g032570.m01.CDS01 [Anthostomella pinea]|uniref:Uu.00g032570.m01.CDS01 n=1 Tax=Anthostomella pinea TaxID=933095 RepID=A0AAI8V8Q1_9PEZI|nr:Uu.00g032570.m01.CDS01 [Anthostomella pinea]
MYNQGKIMRRLLGRPNADSSGDGNLSVTSSPTPQSYRPNASQNAAYPSGNIPIACLDRSPDGRIAVLGGRHILKTIHVDGMNIREGVDVRSIIKAQSASRSNAASLISDQLSIKDAKFASGHGSEPALFTACANGKIFMYDVSRLGSGMGLEFVQTCEGSRQVNKLDFNPHKGTLMLSGGQDGIVRCFDVKTPVASRSGPTFRTIQALHCNADGIRDVKWSPKDGYVFACATESGIVLKWDIRKPTSPLLKINAHDTQKGVTSISWHHDGAHLISSGLDSKCHVWDLSPSAEKRQKPMWSINAPAPVTSVSWRPGLWSATAQGRRAAQIAVSYDEGGNLKKHGISSVHIWDLARPTMPYKELDIFEKSPNDLLWHDQDLLWTAGPDGFKQCDVAFAPKVMDRQPLSSLDFSARGDVLMFLEERAHSRLRPTLSTHERLPASPYSSSPIPQMLSISRSDSEEDVIGSFLGPKRRASGKRRIKRQSQSLSTTPPSGNGVEDQVIPLDQAIKLTSPFRPQQVMAIGHIPAATKMHTIQFLSRQYLEIIERDLPFSDAAGPLNERVSGILEKYARAAESVSQFRLAQTWRILSYAMGMLLTGRSQYHLELRSDRSGKKKWAKQRDEDTGSNFLKPGLSPRFGVGGEDTPRKSPSVSSLDSRHILGKSLLTEEIDSESNLPTPLARPFRESVSESEGGAGGGKLAPVQEMESFTLPPAVHSARPSPRTRLDSTQLSIMSQESQLSSTEGYDFYDLEAVEALPKAIDVPKKKEPLTLDYMGPSTPNSRRRHIARHDSDDSFAQIFPLSEASRQASVLTSSSGGSTRQTAGRTQLKSSTAENVETEYGSRIRGKEIGGSTDQEKHAIRHPPVRHDSGNLTDDFVVSQTTTDTFESGRSYVDETHSTVRLEIKEPPYQQELSQNGTPAQRPEDNTSLTITETDFLPWEDDPPYPHPVASDTGPKRGTPPINPYDILAKAMTFESQHAAHNASAMILLLKPLVPSDIIDSYQAAAILRQLHSRLMGMRLFVEAALLRNLCVRGWPEGIDIWGDNYVSIFRPAQDRVAVGFVCAQCHKPREFDHSATENSGIWKCERCLTIMAPCAVCGHREVTADDSSPTPVSEGLKVTPPHSETPVLSTWWYCPGCAHGGHANCLQDWHGPMTPLPAKEHLPRATSSPTLPEDAYPETNSDGCCPFDGCGHACLPGKWQNENSAARTEELGIAVREQTRGTVGGGLKKSNDASAAATPVTSVKGDGVDVPQSRAVESVREALSMGASGGGSEKDSKSAAGGLLSILSSSPGRGGGSAGAGAGGVHERERRKSVKFAGPSEERR